MEDCPDVVSYAKNFFAVHFKLSDKKNSIVETKGQEDLERFSD